ncbi:MAG: hypothetical protein HYT03_00730 [Candidatus Harrisonbacteria bacterium]|nr:hypothetical protein [Candidatus Harrisonbacteria bacterium]
MSRDLKTIILGAVSIIAAIIFGLAFRNFVADGSLISLIFLALAGALFLSIFLIQTLLLDIFFPKFLIIIFSAIAVGVSSGAPFSTVSITAMSIFSILLLWGYYRGRLELKNSLEIKFTKTGLAILGPASSAIALFAIIAYLGSFNLSDPTSVKETLSIIIKPAEPIAAGYIPGFSIQKSITEIAAALLPEELANASQATKNEFISESASRLSEVFGNLTGVPAKTSDSLLDIFYRATVGRLLALTPFARNLTLIGVGFLIFLMAKFLLIIINWLAIALAVLLYQLLLAMNFCRIELQSKSKTVIVLE